MLLAPPVQLVVVNGPRCSVEDTRRVVLGPTDILGVLEARHLQHIQGHPQHHMPGMVEREDFVVGIERHRVITGEGRHEEPLGVKRGRHHEIRIPHVPLRVKY